MIFYFSATGNSKYVATRLAHATQDSVCSITDYLEHRTASYIPAARECIGIISPTYSWGLPSIVIEFLSQLCLTSATNPYLYFVATYGTTPGQTGLFANQCLRRNGYRLSARFSVPMPDTWTPIFDLSDAGKVHTINQKAEAYIADVITMVQQRKTGDFMKRKPPYILAHAVYHTAYPLMRRTRRFRVENNCIGCGLCAQKCPAHAIKMHNKRPVWSKPQCIMCLGCLHRCPNFSIQYGKHTKKHGQYQNPHVSQ